MSEQTNGECQEEEEAALANWLHQVEIKHRQAFSGSSSLEFTINIMIYSKVQKNRKKNKNTLGHHFLDYMEQKS